MTLTNYDNWLERPYQDMYEESERFYDWAEDFDYDLDDPNEAKEAERAYQDYLQDLYEDYAESQYEAYMDRKYDEMMERDRWDEEYDRW